MLVFVHGWGLDSTLWHPLLAQLGLPAETIDLGYLAAARMPPLPERFVGVGHSFGALWLLHEYAHRLGGLIAVSGFARFTAAPDWPHGRPARPLRRMRAAYARQPADVLTDFRTSCGLPPSDAARDDARLAAGLEALEVWDCRATLGGLAAPVLCLAAADDAVVPPALSVATAALARGACRVIPTGGHALPLTQPDWCAAQIRAFAAA